MKTVTIYTDGACSGNPGPGGWGRSVKQMCRWHICSEDPTSCAGRGAPSNGRTRLLSYEPSAPEELS